MSNPVTVTVTATFEDGVAAPAASLDPLEKTTAAAMDETKDNMGEVMEDLQETPQKGPSVEPAVASEAKEAVVPQSSGPSSATSAPNEDTTNVANQTAEPTEDLKETNEKKTLESPAVPINPPSDAPPFTGTMTSPPNVQTQEVTVSDMDELKTPDSGVIPDADDGDSSNDDSSYFADPSNLPSPKSGGRKYSFSSSHSNPNPITALHSSSSVGAARESDASLSLSESDDEDHHQADPGLYPTPRGTPDVYPQRITRVHSVGSLISTSSQNSEELEQVAAGTNIYLPGEIPSGRLSPVPALSFGTPTSQMASPPTIMPFQYPPYQQNFPHPRAQPIMDISTEDWIAAMAIQQQQQQQGELPRSSVNTASSGGSYGTLNYSDDGEMHAFQQKVNRNTSETKRNAPDRSMPRKKSSGRSDGGSSRASSSKAVAASSRATSEIPGDDDDSDDGNETYQVYWQRWIMLLYMSVLNLLVSSLV